jgi:signal transduction histidine kinase
LVREADKHTIVLERLAYESELRTIESETQEATFNNIAAELHDNIGQLLAVAHMQLEKEKLQHSELAHFLKPAGETLQTVIK